MLASPIALAEPSCNRRGDVLALLAKKYQEAPVAAGVTSSGGLVEVLTTSDGGTWTIILTTPYGWPCLMAAGEGWRRIDKPQPQGTAL